MPAAIECRGLGFAFGLRAAALRDVNLSLPRGSWTLAIGQSGAGKSTLLHALAGLLPQQDAAQRAGSVLVDGFNPQQLPAARRAALVGLVQQSADAQICTTTVESEIAFGLENLTLDCREIEARIAESLEFVDLREQCKRRVTELSGGQRQRLVLAAVLAMRPNVLLLDEPLSQLDPAAAAQFLHVLDRLRNGGPTIVVAEHRVAPWIERVDRLLVLDHGALIADIPRGDQVAWSKGLAYIERPRSLHAATNIRPHEPPLATLDRVGFQFDRRRPPVLTDVSLSLHPGERIALLGANGSGKSTLLALMAGMLRATQGAVRHASCEGCSVGFVPQSPDALLFCRTVREELTLAPRSAKCAKDEIERRVHDAAARFHLHELLERLSIQLSQGERLRVAVAATITLGPRLLLLDEPTTGQDPWHEAELMNALSAAVFAGGPPASLVFSTHDLDVARDYADRVIVLDAGRVIADGEPQSAIATYQQQLYDRCTAGALP